MYELCFESSGKTVSMTGQALVDGQDLLVEHAPGAELVHYQRA
jgi:hypothetical protein